MMTMAKRVSVVGLESKSPSVTQVEKIVHGCLQSSNQSRFMIGTKELYGKGTLCYSEISIIRKHPFIKIFHIGIEYHLELVSTKSSLLKQKVKKSVEYGPHRGTGPEGNGRN